MYNFGDIHNLNIDGIFATTHNTYPFRQFCRLAHYKHLNHPPNLLRTYHYGSSGFTFSTAKRKKASILSVTVSA